MRHHLLEQQGMPARDGPKMDLQTPTVVVARYTQEALSSVLKGLD